MTKLSNTYLSVNQVAARLGTSVATIWRWKRDGTFPAAVKLSAGSTRWRLTDIEIWVSTLQVSAIDHLPENAWARAA